MLSKAHDTIDEIQIEILYFGDCPNYRKACDIICEIVGNENLNANIKLISVSDIHQAERHNFTGSPSVRIDGKDVESCFNEIQELQSNLPENASIACRLYACDHSMGCPSREMIVCALEQID